MLLIHSKSFGITLLLLQMNMIKVSNIMGIDPTPFDPHTYVEEDHYETEESGSKKRIRLENNVIRWRKVKQPDGRTTVSELVNGVSAQSNHMVFHFT